MKLQEKIFRKLFKTAEIANFSKVEMQEYENSLKYYRDLKNVTDTAHEEGKYESKVSMANVMLEENEPIERIMRYTGLSREEIEALKIDKP